MFSTGYPVHTGRLAWATIRPYLATVNTQTITEREARVLTLRRALAAPDKPLDADELHGRLVLTYGEQAVSIRTVRRAMHGDMTEATAGQLASIGDCDPGWLLWGHGREPRMATNRAPVLPEAQSGPDAAVIASRSAAQGSIREMTRQRGGGALARALDKALHNDELAGNRHSLREFARLIYRMALDLKELGHGDSAQEFFMLNNVIRDEADRLDRVARGEEKPK